MADMAERDMTDIQVRQVALDHAMRHRIELHKAPREIVQEALIYEDYLSGRTRDEQYATDTFSRDEHGNILVTRRIWSEGEIK